MRGYPHPKEIREKCTFLRKRGYSLNELVTILQIPKTTIYDWVSHSIILTESAKKRIRQRILNGILKANRKKRINILKPSQWSPDLTKTLAHFLFDGEIRERHCGYYNKNKSQLKRMTRLVKKLFKLKPTISQRDNEVLKLTWHSIELKNYSQNKCKELLSYIKNASQPEKRAFLKAFFDDEGCVTFNKNNKKVRGYQYSKTILRLVKELLKDFEIESRIDKRNTEVTITGKENIIKFQKEINFSPDIYINSERKNGIWKYKIDKKTILEKTINSYQI